MTMALPRRDVVMVALIILGIALFLALGIWQVERRSWKLDLIARVDQRIHQAAVTAPGRNDWPAVNEKDDAYRHVHVRGTLLHAKETYVQASTNHGTGYWVLTPLRSDRGFTVLINRGFVPPEKRDPATRREGQITGPVTVTGLLRMSEPHGRLFRRNDPAHERWYSRDVAAMAAQRELPDTAPYFMDADTTPNPGGWPLGGLTVVSFYNEHLVYALSWFALALMLGLRAASAFHLPRRMSLRAFMRWGRYGSAMEISRAIEQKIHRKNLLQLVYLRSIAIVGQLATILIVRYGLQIALPMPAMFGIIGFLVVLNLVSFYRYNAGKQITNTELLIELLLDAAALTVQLYLSGGAANPFVSLFLLQVIIGAILLQPVYAWILFIATFCCYLTLTFFAHALQPIAPHPIGDFFDLHIRGMIVGYTLAAFLLVFFITKISANLKERDMLLATLKQQSLEEEHVMRMGLLAAGAAHELGTPLTTISIILKDWQSLPFPTSKPLLDDDIQTMQREVARCKDIVSGILLSAGQVRGEAAEIVSLAGFIRSVAERWKATRRPVAFDCHCDMEHITIISDTIIRQTLFNLLDNAFEASPDWVGLTASCTGDTIRIRVQDRGPGFTPDALATFGAPYASSKAGHGRGLGLFLVVNTLRKLGGHAVAENVENGAVVTLHIPLSAIVAGAR